ncbi:hypothetical protein K2E96_15595 [Pseudomonas sp. ERGC3:05]|nr:hypothetical protein K2E96_15595 [Pseudomonas sp. ERGC3:05]
MPISLIPYANSQNGRPSPADNSPFTFASSSESPQPARQSLGGFAPPAPEGDQKQLPVFAPIETRGGLRSPGRFGQPSEGTDPVAVRREKRALVQTPDKPARNTLGLLAGAHSHSADADETLQTQLIAQMGSVPDALVTVPVRSLMSQPFDIYKRVLNQPEVLAWLRGKGFSLDSVTIGKNAVSGLVTHNGVTSHQAYTLQDTSGWWQVSARVMHALEALDPTHQGVPYVSINSQQISRNVASLFYGVSPPHTAEQANALVTSLEAGWPALSAAETRNHPLRSEWSKRVINELDDRENLADALERTALGVADSRPLSLSGTEFEVSRTNPLKRDGEARRRLAELVALPEMQGVLADLGQTLSDQTVRISEGHLQVLQPTLNQWLDVPVSDRWSQPLKDALAAVVVLSEQTGNALYSDDRHDLRQVARSMGLGALDTAGQARAAAQWLRTHFPPTAPVGNYAKLLPQAWAAGTLSASDKTTLISLATDQKYGANTIGLAWGRQIVTQVDPQETAARADPIWDELLNTPQAQQWGRELAQALGWYKGEGDDDIDAAQRKSLLTAAIMLSVEPNVPAAQGSAAGYQFYTPANMGREMRAVRKDFEKHLIEKKGVSARAAPLVAHLFLAHAAPEFLVKPDQQESTKLPEPLRQSPDKIRVGSPTWMTVSLGSALAEVWGGAGASRGMSLNELGALTTLETVQPQQQALAIALGAKRVLDVGIMTGTVPRRSDGNYTPGDYQLASDGITRRSEAVEQSIVTLGTAPPTRSSLAIKALKQAFPELTDSEIETITVRKPATQRSLSGVGINTKWPTLVEAYATGDLHQHWFSFSHPRITQAQFDARIKTLPPIADQVGGAVDHYLSNVKGAMPSLMKMSLADLPLDVRQAMEWGEVQVYRLRRETGETQPEDAGRGSKVAENRGWHGVLLVIKYEGKNRLLEFFPTSGTVIDRTASLAGKRLSLNEGVIEEETVPRWRSGTKTLRYLRGTQAPFDFNAYLTGEAPRNTTSSKVIISKVGASMAGAASKGSGDNRNEWVPDTFGSAKSQAIIDVILSGNYIGNYSGHRQAFIDHANAVLPSEDNVRGYVNRLMSKENGRALVSMISFIGPLVDIYEGNIKDGLKGLAIDTLLFIGAGGLQATRKAWNAIRFASRLNKQAFRVSVLKEGTALLRGIFNPSEGFFGLPNQPSRLGDFLRRARKGVSRRDRDGGVRTC